MSNLEIQISGRIQNSNLDLWKNELLLKISSTNLELITDNDFAAATEDVKYFKLAEKNIKDAKIKAISQTEEIQSLFNALDQFSEHARQTRLTLERQIRVKKQEIKDGLIHGSIQKVHDYIASKSEVYSRLDNSKHLLKYEYDLAVKGKSTISGVEAALNNLVENIKIKIDVEFRKVNESFRIINSIDETDKVLFQDVDYLVRLPENELRLTIDNRISKLSEQNALKHAEEAEKELKAIDNAELLGIKSEEKGQYVISIEMSSTRDEAIEIAREIKQALNRHGSALEIKLSRKHQS